MHCRPIMTPPPPSEADIDTPEMIEAARAAERDEYDVRVLTEVIEIGMRLMRAHETYATARMEAAAAAGADQKAEDHNAAFGKLAQAVRRTVALKKQLGEEVKTRRAGLVAERAARRAKRAEDHAEAVNNTLEMALNEAFHADLTLPESDPEAESDITDAWEVERMEMLGDAEMLLEDLEEYGDWLNRPIGETVAKLCVALGLAPDVCFKRGDTWWVRRSDTAYEIIQEEKRASSSSLPQSGEGPDAKRPGWGAAGKPPTPDAAAAAPP